MRRLAMEVGLGLKAALPKLRKKTVVSKVALAVGAMIEGQTPNTAELANLLPLDTDRHDMREHVVAPVVEESVAGQRGCWSLGHARLWRRRVRTDRPSS